MNSYDEVPYLGRAFGQTHPDRLATMARLFGMNPAPVERCRVLELGCGDGGNLIPMAYRLPDSTFVGVDLAEGAIGKGRETAAALGLRNIELRALDIAEAAEDLGGFDYILAHGVYSWVPAAVQEKLLEVACRNLNPQGVAYISYSVYPGAHLRNMMAEMLQFHTRRCTTPEEKIGQARALVDFLGAAEPGVAKEAEGLRERTPHGLYHDELAEVHSAVYFHEFAARAARHGLQYLGEVDFFEMLDTLAEPGTTAMMRQMARSVVEKEQYLDFLKCRRFRQTLLCHADVRLKRGLRSVQMKEFWIGARRGRKAERLKVLSEHPVAEAVQKAAQEVWPGALSFEELKMRTGALDEELLGDIVLALFSCGSLQLHVRPPKFAAAAGDRPRASALARLQAGQGREVTNLCHHAVRLENELAVRLLVALDGTRNRAKLAEQLGVGVEELERGLEGLAGLALLEE